MPKKFAKIEYVSNESEIPQKFNIIKQSPNRYMDWYVKKYKPFIIAELKYFGETGYFMKLPVTESEAYSEKSEKIWDCAIDTLKSFNVEIILPPKSVPFTPKGVRVADGRRLFPFLINAALNKLYGEKAHEKEAVILGDDCTLTGAFLKSLAPEVRVLSVVTSPHCVSQLKKKALEIFKSSGLEICVTTGIEAVSGADIIVNGGNPPKNPDFILKRGAVFFDLSGDSESLTQRARRRRDILFTDSCIISRPHTTMPLNCFEMVFYAASADYRLFLENGEFTPNNLDIRINAFTRFGKKIPQSEINRVLRR